MYYRIFLVLSILYTIIIFPLTQLIEISWVVVYKIFKNPGFAIVGVSAAVSICTLPLYFIAEKHQQAEREIQKRLKPGIDNIKAVFSGDEQYMILSTYYRQNHYHPVYALRSSLGLLIQIPFFLAAYSYLSGLGALKGVPFFFIKDLGAPDAILPGVIAGYSLNLLPVLMTFINCVAGAVYTKGLPVKEKVQLYGMAAVFLVLLYNSPSGLVLYWTMNNVISLIKNCLQRVKNSKIIVSLCIYVFVAGLDIYLLIIHTGAIKKRIVLAALCSVVFLRPLIGRLYLWGKGKLNASAKIQTSSGQVSTFVFSVIILFLLAGLVIPGALIASSVQEFSFIEEGYASPFQFIGNTMLQAAGLFLFWPLCFYLLFTSEVKDLLTVLLSLFCVVALINTFLFPGDYGFLTPMLSFSDPVESSLLATCLNIFGLIVGVILSFLLLVIPKKTFFFCFQFIMLISLAGIGAINAVKIHREYAEFALRGIAAIKNETPDPVYSFSKDGKNVLVIMLDRGINGFVPYVFEEKPELKSSFGGFTYYPNCVSFGGSTLFGASGLFGGYEYTPLEMQKRSDESLISKHDEALLVLPKLFLDNDYSVTVTDPPLAGYSWVPDLSCFNRYPEIRAEIVSEGNAYGDYWSLNRQDLQVTMVAPLLDAHLIRFSFFKSVPLVFRSLIYDQGRWLGPPGVGLAKGTINNYASLDILPDITTVTDGEKNSLIMLSNSLTHEPDFFQAPDYVPVSTVTDRGESTFANEVHYHANMAAYILLGKWFDFLKENGVYDNTRIIIVSDHGRNLFNDFPGNITLPNGECLESFGALLLVKDFNASGDLVTDNTFMTNADVPLLASQGIIGDPINPFTQVPLQGGKEKGITITTSVFNSPSLHGKYTFKINKDEWLRVHDNIFDPVNWEKVEL